MKKLLSTAFTGCFLMLLQAHTAAVPSRVDTPAPYRTGSSQALLTYYWFSDPDFNDYTGYSSTIETEVYRLRALYPYYNFSAAPAIGMTEFEWGMHSFYIPAVIYSNM